jgi:hypothetical protein
VRERESRGGGVVDEEGALGSKQGEERDEGEDSWVHRSSHQRSAVSDYAEYFDSASVICEIRRELMPIPGG